MALQIGLHLVVLIAAFLQAVTGIGFALIAGPVILLAMNDGSAFQVTAVLSFLIAIVLAPRIWRFAHKDAFKALGVGAALGLIPGILLYATVGANTLKIGAGLVLTALCVQFLFGARSEGQKRPVNRGIGFISGCLGGALAMPGPTAAIGLARAGADKTVSRATILSFFVLFYPFIFLGQSLAAGLTQDTVTATALFVPATLAGTFAGRWAEPHVNETHYRRAVLFFLVVIACSLLVTGFREVV